MGRDPFAAFPGQGGPLGHAEAVLLVGHNEGQIVKGHRLGNEGVGADNEVNFPLRQGGLDLLLF